MTPSNQHSAEAVAAYADGTEVLAQEIDHDDQIIAAVRTAFDRGRAFKHLTDRGTLVSIIDPLRRTGGAACALADAILSSPSLSLVAVRDEVAWVLWCANEGYLLDEDREVIDNWFTAQSPDDDHPDDNRQGWLELADSLIASLGIADRSEVEAAALEAAALEIDAMEEAHQNDDRAYRNGLSDASRIVRLACAARVRSGKAEA